MIDISPAVTLATLATADRRTPAVLDRFGLDYCCRGHRTLAAACREEGVRLAEVLAALDLATGDTTEPDDWTTMGPAELVDHLVATHHGYLTRELPRLVALADKVAGVHGTAHPELVEVDRLVRELRDDLEPHLAKEELVLFPMIRELVADDGGAAPPMPAASSMPPHCGSIRNPVTAMLREHDLAGALLEDIRRATSHFLVPDDACGSYRALYDGLVALEADTHLHVHKENHALFPMAVEADTRRARAGGSSTAG